MSGSKHRNPYPTVDVVIEIEGGIVLIERRNEPKGWALPGGFIDYGEDPADAARREVREETGLEVELTELLGVYGKPDRDPRQHNLSVVYLGRASGAPEGGDDAARAAIFPADRPPQPLAFDHAQILADYRRYRATGERPRPAPAREVLTPTEAQDLLRIARHAIEDAIAHRPVRSDPHERSPGLTRKAGCFVTLRGPDRELRGCIGDLSAERPLVEAIRHSAIGAALRDPRFMPVTAQELASLHIGLSVLTPLRPARAEEVEVGRHGLLIERGPMRGVLLPEVAVEQGWTREQFLAGTCRKAGLPLDAWRAPGTAISVFETLKIAE